MSGYWDAFKNRRIADTRTALIDAYASLETWMAENAQLRLHIDELKFDIDVWRAHYAGLEAERDYLLSELDKAVGGAENNPARKPVHKEGDFRIENVPRKGEFPQMRDHHYITKLAKVISGQMPHLGSRKKLIREREIHD